MSGGIGYRPTPSLRATPVLVRVPTAAKRRGGAHPLQKGLASGNKHKLSMYHRISKILQVSTGLYQSHLASSVLRSASIHPPTGLYQSHPGTVHPPTGLYQSRHAIVHHHTGVDADRLASTFAHLFTQQSNSVK